MTVHNWRGKDAAWTGGWPTYLSSPVQVTACDLKIWLTFWKNLCFCDQTRASWQIFLLRCLFTEQFTIWKHFPDPLLFFHTSEDISRSLMITCKIYCLKTYCTFQKSKLSLNFSQKSQSKIIEKWIADSTNLWLLFAK